MSESRSAADPRIERLGFRLKEAAESLGVSERHIRQILPELPHVRLGSVVVVPVDLLREWLRSRSEAEKHDAGETAREILEKLND